MSNINFKIKQSKNVFYTTSKDELEGFIKNEYTDKKTKTTTINYHKEVNSLTGVLKGIRLKDSDYGKYLTLILEESPETTLWLEIPIFDAQKRISPYVKSICQYLENLRFNVETVINLNRTKKDKAGYFYKTVFFKQGDVDVKWAFSSYGEESIVPPWEKTANKVTGEITWDSSNQDKFYYDLIIRCTTKPETVTNTVQEAPKEDPAAPKVAESNMTEAMPFNNDELNTISDDDLPF